METNWNYILRRIDDYPNGVHRIRPPCEPERVIAIQAELGRMPQQIVEMLKHFNGGKLFCRIVPFVSIFGVSVMPLLPSLENASDWYVDRFTPIWRESKGGCDEWTIGMTNYGGLLVMDSNANVREWNTSESIWSPQSWSFNEWIEHVFIEGDNYLSQ